MRNFKKSLVIMQWIIIPIALFWVAEIFVGRTKPVMEKVWYSRAEEIASHVKLDYFFIGSSRVAAAINEKAFEEFMGQKMNRRVECQNMGQGYSTIQQHYMGIRNLFDKHPDRLDGAIFFFEAPGDMANIPYYTDWNGKWINSNRVQMLIPFLQFDDYINFMLKSGDEWGDKVHTSFKYLLNPFKLIRHREKLKEQLDIYLRSELTNIIINYDRSLIREKKEALDLERKGGIKTADVDIRRYKKMAEDFAKEMMDAEHEFSDWDNTNLWQLIRMIEAKHGQVFFFYMPVSSAQKQVFDSLIHRENKKLFDQQLKKYNFVILRPDFSYVDSDFPDSWHLRSSRSGEFTRKLGEAYLKYMNTSTGMTYKKQ